MRERKTSGRRNRSGLKTPARTLLREDRWKIKWRRERDSNPRCRFKQHTRFPVVLLQPARTSLRIVCSRHTQPPQTPCGPYPAPWPLHEPAFRLLVAERVGFEPTIPFLTGYRFSRAGPSATRQPLQYRLRSLKQEKALIILFGPICQSSSEVEIVFLLPIDLTWQINRRPVQSDKQQALEYRHAESLRSISILTLSTTNRLTSLNFKRHCHRVDRARQRV